MGLPIYLTKQAITEFVAKKTDETKPSRVVLVLKVV